VGGPARPVASTLLAEFRARGRDIVGESLAQENEAYNMFTGPGTPGEHVLPSARHPLTSKDISSRWQ
jgi:hypothetical protein